ncbi:hypothetical protein [Solibacillus ferritrahens]|uniref:hypothetical protein n=1 Tax=Solibacillus ferritrahens TaxID=3098620 RepID=UPI00300A3A7E
MEKREIEFKILSKRVAYREYDVQAFVNGDEYLTFEYNDCNSAFAAHTMLRRLIHDHPNALITLKTNVNAVLSDLRLLHENDRTLTRYLRETLDDSNSEITKAEYTAF